MGKIVVIILGILFVLNILIIVVSNNSSIIDCSERNSYLNSLKCKYPFFSDLEIYSKFCIFPIIGLAFGLSLVCATKNKTIKKE